jgi:hypothetical protein
MSLESYGSSRLFSLNDLTSQLLLPMADLQLHTMWDSPSGVDINNLFCLHVGLLIILLRSFYIDLLKHLCCVVMKVHMFIATETLMLCSHQNTCACVDQQS